MRAERFQATEADASSADLEGVTPLQLRTRLVPCAIEPDRYRMLVRLARGLCLPGGASFQTPSIALHVDGRRSALS